MTSPKIPQGCCKGKHNNVKPEEPAKEEESCPPPESIKPPERMVRPNEDMPLVPLPTTISASLRKLLNKMTVSDKTGSGGFQRCF